MYSIPGTAANEFTPAQFEEAELSDILDNIGTEVLRAEKLYPHWPTDLNYGDQIINEEKGEATKALLDISSGKATIEDVIDELTQTAAMCVRQIAAIQTLLG